MPSTTASTSAPYTSHRSATSLMKLNFVARNAFEAFLIISAELKSVTMTGASMSPYSARTAAEVRFSSPSLVPMTIRVGVRKS